MAHSICIRSILLCEYTNIEQTEKYDQWLIHIRLTKILRNTPPVLSVILTGKSTSSSKQKMEQGV